MAARQQPSLTDWVVIAISPVLIMLMVGSLVFFLVEVLYRGQYNDRLLYILFWFVFATVLIARISIEEGYSKASMYGLALAAATFIALNAFVAYPNKALQAFAAVINVGLMAVIWWSAHKLTWDCTHIDEDRKASGRGVLAAAGLDDTAAADNPVQQREDEEAAAEEEKPKKRKKDPGGLLGWLTRYDRHREAQRKKPHTPGVWVVYFSLAALPLFGLGQALIPADDADRRRATFLQMAVYVGSGLGLLVTTSLLGLRKYLRDRGAKVPAAMTMGWLGLGAGLIVLFLAVGAVLPRPHSETPLLDLGRGEKKNRQASKYAVVRDESAGQGEGAAGKKTEAGKDGKASGKSQEKGGNAGEKGGGGGKGNDSGGKQSGGDKGGGQKGNQQGGKGNDESRGKADKGDRRNDPNNQNRQQDGKRDENNRGGRQPDEKQQSDGRDEQSRDADGNASDSDRSSDTSSSRPQLGKALETVGSFLKWVVWVLVAVAVIAGIFIFFLKFLAPFTDWAKNLLDWLKSLFARKPRVARGEVEEEAAAEEAVRRPPPFSDFGNPFDDGSAGRMGTEELIGYSFAALESWAWDRDRGRPPGETPNEFAARLGGDFPALDKSGRTLASLYVWVLYSDAEPPGNAVELVRQFWSQIEQPVEGAVEIA